MEVLSSPPSELPIPGVEELSAEELILAAYEQFGERLCLTCSWQKQSSVLVHMVAELGVKIDVGDLIFEAPTKAAQAWFVKHLGPEVYLGNIPPDEVIPLETLRLGLRADTIKEVLLAEERATTS